MLSICSCDDVVYGLYKSAGRIASASKYGHDMYANAIENVSSNTTSCEEKCSVYYVRRRVNIFDVMEFQQR